MAEDPRSEARRNAQAQLEATLEEMGTVLVRAGRDDGRVALWDTGPEYEGGEVMIKGYAGDPDRDYTYELPRTAMVMQKIAEGALIETEDEGEGAGPAPDPAPLRLTPDSEPMATSGENEADNLADKREKMEKAEESGNSAPVAAASSSDKPSSAAPHGGSTPSTSEGRASKK